MQMSLCDTTMVLRTINESKSNFKSFSVIAGVGTAPTGSRTFFQEREFWFSIAFKIKRNRHCELPSQFVKFTGRWLLQSNSPTQN